MSSYALSSIMMTPSTFRRRNVKGRSTGNDLHRKKSNTSRQMTSSISMKPPPNTFTVFGQTNNNTSESSTNFSLSQITMSQLSDSMSHQTRPSKIARTSLQVRPSAPLRSNRECNSSYHHNINGNFGLSRRLNEPFPVNNIRRITKDTRPTLPEALNKNVISEQEHSTLDFDSQLRSQELLVSPQPPPKINHHHRRLDVNDNAMTPGVMSSRSTNRKRSWMEACIEVMKTPYRKGKSIAQKIAKPIISIKTDYDEHDARNVGSTAIKSSPSTSLVPVINTRNVDNQPASTAPSTNNNADTETPSTIQVLNETKDIMEKLESMKENVHKERVELEAIRSSITDEKKALVKAREDFEKAKNDLDQKREAFTVEVWAAEQKFNANARDTELTYKANVQGLKDMQSKFFSDLSAKEGDIVDTYEKILVDFKSKSNEFKLMLDEMKIIQKKATALITPMKSTTLSKKNRNLVRNQSSPPIPMPMDNEPYEDQQHSANPVVDVTQTSSAKDINAHECKVVSSSSEEESDDFNSSIKISRVGSNNNKNELPKYNLRSNYIQLNDAGVRVEGVNENSNANTSLKQISKNYDHGVEGTNKQKATTKRKLVKNKNIIASQSLSSSQIINTNKITTKPLLTLNNPGTNNKSLSSETDTAKMTAQNKKTLTYGRSIRRRRLNGPKVTGNSSSEGYKHGQRENANNSFRPIDPFLSPDGNLGNSSRNNVIMNIRRFTRTADVSPKAINSFEMPPPVPHLNGSTRPQRTFIAPRFTQFSVDDDSLSFK